MIDKNPDDLGPRQVCNLKVCNVCAHHWDSMLGTKTQLLLYIIQQLVKCLHTLFILFFINILAEVGYY